MRRRGRLVKPTGDRTNGQDADALIEEIVQDRGRPVSEEEMALILEHVASASFDPDKRRVKPALRGVSYRGYEIGEREPSLISHLAQRVVVDQQWAESTTTQQYLDDLRAAARHPSARVAVGIPAGSAPLLYLFAPNEIPEQRRGPKALPLLFVLYSTISGVIITGYQVSGLKMVRLPQGARWLG